MMNKTTERTYLLLFGILAALGLAADQASKYAVFSRHYPKGEETRQTTEETSLIGDEFKLKCWWMPAEPDAEKHPLASLRWMGGPRMPHVNHGALFGIGGTTGGMNLVFAAVSLGAACFIIYWVARSAVARDWVLCAALGSILGGTIGNFYDRVVFGGVRDFLHADFGFWPCNPWPDFNIADVCLVCGACTLMVHSFFAVEAPADAPPVTESTAAAPVVAGEAQPEVRV